MNLEVDKLSFKYLSSKSYIFKDFSFSLQDSHFPVRIEGRNGIGKTTLIKLICGIEKPNSGSINYTPSNIIIGYTPQQPIVIPWLSVYRNIHLVSNNNDVLFKNYINDFQEFPHELSGGQLQILSLIMSLNALDLKNGNAQHLLILDEPLKSLDRDNIQIVQKMINEFILNYSAKLIYISHQGDIVKPNSILTISKNENNEIASEIAINS